jgi:hypothetical protein
LRLSVYFVFTALPVDCYYFVNFLTGPSFSLVQPFQMSGSRHHLIAVLGCRNFEHLLVLQTIDYFSSQLGLTLAPEHNPGYLVARHHLPQTTITDNINC